MQPLDGLVFLIGRRQLRQLCLHNKLRQVQEKVSRCVEGETLKAVAFHFASLAAASRMCILKM